MKKSLENKKKLEKLKKFWKKNNVERLENLHFSRLESKQKILQGGKPELAQITGV